MSRLRESIDVLTKWLRDSGAPAWSEVLLVEVSDKTRFDRTPANQERIHVPRAELHTLESYQTRFDHLLDQGYSWINLSGFGLLGTTLVILVEIPRESASAKRTSVNLSGPPLTRGWDASNCVVLEEE
jgi:hypothetical protein